MLGKRKMTHSGTAEILSVKVVGSGLGPGYIKYEFILDVRPEGAEPFRTKCRHHFDLNHHPQMYDTLRVVCDPESKTAEFSDLDGDPRYDPKAGKAARKAYEQRLLDG